MIITEQKPFKSIIKNINGDSIFLIGCNQCAALCHTGGEPEIRDLLNKFKNTDIKVTGWLILDPACHLLNNKRLLKPHKTKIEKADNLLVFSCGNGVQVISTLYPNKHVISGTNTLFLGAEINHGSFDIHCTFCGSCIIYEFGGLCPIARCPKNMLNGPCGGSKDGKCEVFKEIDCIWEIIIRKKLQMNKITQLKKIVPPKDWTSYRSYNWGIKHKL
jgi:hypothetical protein